MIALLFLLTSPILANGQTTHLWISQTAITHIEDTTLLDLLVTNSEQLALGTMFPDGGYAIGHAYAETAHWEPFQDEFRDWIRTTFDGPDDPLAAPHIAFYMGLASHGMADQVFDSMYMERSKVYDADLGWSDEAASLDTSQDVVFAHLTSPSEPPDPALPEILPELFAKLGVDVDMDTLLEGQGWLDVAVNGVAGMSEVSRLIDMHTAAFPWGCSHLLDEDVPGSPPFEAQVVARYWESLWSDLHENEQILEVIGWWPPTGTTGYPSDAGDVEARLSVVFNRGLYDHEVTTDHFGVMASESPINVDLNLFYRDHSHVVNISPTEGWSGDTKHLLLIEDVTATDGREMASVFEMDFNTGTPDTASTPPKESGCSQARGPYWAWMVCLSALALRRRGSLGS